MSNSKKQFWIYWALITLIFGVYLVMQLKGEEQTIYLPGKTTHGHYQIEMACSACHSDAFGGEEVLQDACMNCHGKELEIADDSHPKSKFTNPRNADRVAQLDARKCVTCHSEHREEITQDMGVTLPDDFCFKCHDDVAENRPSHKGMAFNTCASAGCHNFHDNRGLYEDFLARHIDEAELLETALVKTLSDSNSYVDLPGYPGKRYPIKSLEQSDIDLPESHNADPKIVQDWLSTSHSQAGVNCTACHEQKVTEQASPVWVDKPDQESCKSCHNDQVSGFLSGKHGMRQAQGLDPMRPGLARSNMKVTAHNKEVTCISCHAAHRFDSKHAAVAACLSCHDDRHSRAYKDSPHFDLWHKAKNGQLEENKGVSCATCHLPRKTIKQGDVTLVISEHNQNDNLRPNEKMLRSVCMQCHGLGFSIDALADSKLIKKNFSERPNVHIQSLDLVKQRLGSKKDSDDK